MASKDYLYKFLQKKKIVPNYSWEELRRGNQPMFKCTLKVDGYPYIAMGNSRSKKDSQTNAAIDFLNYLVRQGEVNAAELPSLSANSLEATSVSSVHTSTWSPYPGPAMHIDLPSETNSQGWHPDQNSSEAQKHHLTSYDLYITQRAEEVAQSESVDLKAEIHGGWTAENSKQALNEFMQKIKQPPASYVTMMKEANSRDFCSTLMCYIPHLGKELRSEGRASTKKMAESICAMHVVRQLFHMNLMAAYQGGRKRVSKDNIPSIPVANLSEDIVQVIKGHLASHDINPVQPNLQTACPESPQSLLVDNKLAHFPDSEVSPPCSVSWSPPQQNWNPWRACNIDEPPLVFMALPEISAKITEKEQMKPINPGIQPSRQLLPVAQFREEIISTIEKNPVTLIKGETGCGKSTQVVQFILESYLEAGKGAEFNAFVSQPRRISAISLAERVAAERNEQLGDSVGYGVRFDAVLPRPYGSIFFCTVGVLLRKMESGLRGVSHVIIDEIHERDIDTDFVLVVLREMIKEFRDLRIILMSATINSNMFTNYFGDCPIIEIHERTHPVERLFLEDILTRIEYIPSQSANTKDDDETEETDEDRPNNLNILPNSVEASPNLRLAMSRISESDIPYDLIEILLLDICKNRDSGAILVFLPGWQEIMTLLSQLTAHPFFGNPEQAVILPLHSQLTGAEQRRVFEHFPEGVRKIILSTNIAETSVTIDDVVFVVDSCKSRERLYSTTNNMVHYATVWASRSNLKQRCGRAGRVRPGFTFHLCSKLRFEALDEHRTAEILRTPLTTVALTIKLLHLGSVGDFLAKAIEPPPVDMVVESETVLQNMGALDRNLELTPLGKILAKLPIEPGIGKTIVLAASFGIGSLMCELAAASSFSTPFIPRDRRYTRLSGPQRSFAGSRFSDHIALIAVNQQFCEASEQGPGSEQSFVQRYSLSPSMLKMSRGACNQLLDTLRATGFPLDSLSQHYANVNGEDENLDLLTSFIIAAYYPNVGFYKGKRKLYTLEQASALVSKQSIITPFKGDVINLPSPLIVFTEKVRSRVIQCKEITVINAFQLLLFGCRRVECIGKNQVRLDEMITLQMDPNIAALVVALRPVVEYHIIRICMNPQSLQALCGRDRELGNILRFLSSPKLFSEAEMKDYLLTDSAVQGVQPVSRGGYRGRGRGNFFDRGAGGHNQWGFGSSNSYQYGNQSSEYQGGNNYSGRLMTPGYGRNLSWNSNRNEIPDYGYRAYQQQFSQPTVSNFASPRKTFPQRRGEGWNSRGASGYHPYRRNQGQL